MILPAVRNVARHPATFQLTRNISTTIARSKDPWPLPHTPEHLASTATGSDISPPTPIPRPNEPVEQLRARLVYQSRKRGTLESDLLLSTFARDSLVTMNEAELKEYDKVREGFVCRTDFWIPVYCCYLNSCWTNRIGTFIIGAQERERLPHDGRTVRCWDSWQCTRKTRGKSSEKCPRFHDLGLVEFGLRISFQVIVRVHVAPPA